MSALDGLFDLLIFIGAVGVVTWLLVLAFGREQ